MGSHFLMKIWDISFLLPWLWKTPFTNDCDFSSQKRIHYIVHKNITISRKDFSLFQGFFWQNKYFPKASFLFFFYIVCILITMEQLHLHFSIFCLWAQGHSVAATSSTSKIWHKLHNTQQKLNALLTLQCISWGIQIFLNL